MSYVLRVVRPANLMNWIKTNAAGSVRGTPRDSWRAYLVAQGATGKTIGDMERSFVAAQPGQKLSEKWANYAAAQLGTKGKEKIKNLYK